MSEVNEIVKNLEEKEQMKLYLKTFLKLSKDKSEKLGEEIKSLGNVKINAGHLVKIVDYVPKEKEDVNKIFADLSLTEDETNAILNITQKY